MLRRTVGANVSEKVRSMRAPIKFKVESTTAYFGWLVLNVDVVTLPQARGMMQGAKFATNGVQSLALYSEKASCRVETCRGASLLTRTGLLIFILGWAHHAWLAVP
jgi:hypothetical protein